MGSALSADSDSAGDLWQDRESSPRLSLDKARWTIVARARGKL